MGINSFAEAEQWYNGTPPVREHGYSTTRDLRPVGDRRKKWERIVKVNRNTYTLMCGDYADRTPLDWGRATEKEQIKLAPITWRRDREGVEYITIRNGLCYRRYGGNYARYKFTNMMLPWRLGFECRGGKQFINCRGNGYSTTHYLRKSRVCTKYDWERSKVDKAAGWRDNRRHPLSPRDDGAALTFQRLEDGSFVYASGGLPEEFIRTRVNIPAKKKHLSNIHAFWDWLLITSPLIEHDSWQSERDAEAKLREDRGFESGTTRGRYGRNEAVVAKQALAIMADDQHPMRVPLAVLFLRGERTFNWSTNQWGTTGLSTTSDKEQITKSKNRYNRWVNNTCDFTYKVTETK